MSGKKAATNRKKIWPFSPPNKTNAFMSSFSGTGVEATWTNEKEKNFSAPNKTNGQGKDSLRRIKCAAI